MVGGWGNQPPHVLDMIWHWFKVITQPVSSSCRERRDVNRARPQALESFYESAEHCGVEREGEKKKVANFYSVPQCRALPYSEPRAPIEGDNVECCPRHWKDPHRGVPWSMSGSSRSRDLWSLCKYTFSILSLPYQYRHKPLKFVLCSLIIMQCYSGTVMELFPFTILVYRALQTPLE